MQKLLSRKLWVALLTIGGIVAKALDGTIPWEQALMGIVPIVLAYLGLQTVVDVRERALAAQTPAGEVVATPTADGAHIAIGAEGAKVELVVGKGKETEVLINGKPLSKLQFPKDYLPFFKFKF